MAFKERYPHRTAMTQPPVVGAKTITDTKQEVFAGSTAPLLNRRVLSVFNDDSQPAFFGPESVTADAGFPLFPGQMVELQFDPQTYVPIYFIASDGNSVKVRVWESK